MSNVYFVPGNGGAELFLIPPNSSKVWLSYTAQAYGALRQMQLAPDGANPLPPFGEYLSAGGPLPSFFDAPLAAAAAQLTPAGYTLIPWGYDWRLPAYAAAQLLATRIIADGGLQNPATIIGYSYGALIARRAYWQLGQSGQASAVRRIISIGGPHGGSYGIPLAFIGESTSLTQLFLLISLGQAGLLFGGQQIIGSPMSMNDAIRIFQSWPSTYELMPLLGGPSAAADPLRASLFGQSWPADIQPPAARLNYATQNWQPWLLSPASIPPPAVLTCCVGHGTPTASALRQPLNLGNVAGYDFAGDGDGQVLAADAALPGAAIVDVMSSHADIYLALIDNALLLGLVDDPRTPPSPAPAPLGVARPMARTQNDPPMPPSEWVNDLAGIGRQLQPGQLDC